MCNLEYKGTDKTANNKRKAKILRFFINFRPKVLVVYKKVVPLHPQIEICYNIGVWCNGNTADSGPAFPGSSPGTPTQEKKKGFHCGKPFFLFVLGVDGFDFLADEVHVIFEFLYLAVHFVDEAVAFL